MALEASVVHGLRETAGLSEAARLEPLRTHVLPVAVQAWFRRGCLSGHPRRMTDAAGIVARVESPQSFLCCDELHVLRVIEEARTPDHAPVTARAGRGVIVRQGDVVTIPA